MGGGTGDVEMIECSHDEEAQALVRQDVSIEDCSTDEIDLNDSSMTAITKLRIEQEVDELFSPNVHDLIRFRYCSKCKQVKPPRAHHCSICQKCVLRMDHHCPWVGNCVGHKTHKYFWNFLLYSFLGTSQVAITLTSMNGLLQFASYSFYSAIATVLSFAFSISIAILLCFHTYLLLNNMTTLEMGALTWKNPFDKGSKRKNWESTFGSDVKSWFLPIPPVDISDENLIKIEVRQL